MFADIIRNASTEHEVYFLLTSYIESVRSGDKLNCGVSERITGLPLNGSADVKERFKLLLLELDAASKRLDDNACEVIREGMHILSSALIRLNAFDEKSVRLQGVPVPGFNVQAAHAT
jgi:hypothetical protein